MDIYRACEQFPREHKYTLGQRLKELALDLMTQIVAANHTEDKREILERARLTVEQLRIHIRLSSDLKILGLKRYEYLNRSMEEVSKQITGWHAWAVRSFQKE